VSGFELTGRFNGTQAVLSSSSSNTGGSAAGYSLGCKP